MVCCYDSDSTKFKVGPMEFRKASSSAYVNKFLLLHVDILNDRTYLAIVSLKKNLKWFNGKVFKLIPVQSIHVQGSKFWGESRSQAHMSPSGVLKE